MATVTRTTVFADNNVLYASQLNNEFNNLLNALQLVNADISSSAAIAPSKINFGGTNGQYLQSNGNGTLSYVGLTVNRAFGFYTVGGAVSNDVSWDPIAPESMTAVKIWAHCQTAPTGTGSLTVQVYNITQAHVVASVVISISGTDANSSSMTNASISAGDVLRMDITAVGGTIAGSNISMVLECTQP